MDVTGDANAVIIHPDDNVVTVTVEIPADGTVVWGSGQIRASMPIPYGHKVALRALAAGDAVIKYGQLIGRAAGPIAAGEHIHTHNLSKEDW